MVKLKEKDIYGPSLNTQSCIRGLLVVRDFCFWAVQAARPIQKKRVWADYEQLFRVVFSCFGGQKKFNFFFKYFSNRGIRNRIEKLHKMAFIIFFLFCLKKFEKVEKTGIIPTKFSLRCTPSVILGAQILIST